MKPIKPVVVSAGAFAFCRYSLALILWIALFLHVKWLVLLGLIILLLSAILRVGRAPLILLYTYTVNKIFKSKDTILDENAMLFAHTFGAVLCAIAVILLYFVNEKIGWLFVLFIAIAKTVGAMGFCAASKFYGCLNNSAGKCCRFSRHIKK